MISVERFKKVERIKEIIEKIHEFIGFLCLGIGGILVIYYIVNYNSPALWSGYYLMVIGWILTVTGGFIYTSDWYLFI